jgi:hypothetical protein
MTNDLLRYLQGYLERLAKGWPRSPASGPGPVVVVPLPGRPAVFGSPALARRAALEQSKLPRRPARRLLVRECWRNARLAEARRRWESAVEEWDGRGKAVPLWC